jgi:hypothetical protein
MFISLYLVLFVAISVAFGGRTFSNSIVRSIHCQAYKDEAAKERLKVISGKAEIVSYISGLISVFLVTFILFI